MNSLTDQITTCARERHLSAQTLARWQAWTQDDQVMFLRLVQELHLGENQARDFLDWLEEIVLRDGSTLRDVLTLPALQRPLNAKMARNDKLKAVKDALRKVRYPQLSRLEENLRAAVKALDLGSRVRISFPPAFEGDEVTVTITARSVQELEASVAHLRQRLNARAFQLLFDLLDQR